MMEGRGLQLQRKNERSSVSPLVYVYTVQLVCVSCIVQKAIVNAHNYQKASVCKSESVANQHLLSLRVLLSAGPKVLYLV